MAMQFLEPEYKFKVSKFWIQQQQFAPFLELCKQHNPPWARILSFQTEQR
jgi:hypothetical protein